MEKVGKAILNYSSFAGNDVIRFFELTLFCFLTGNTDMHLKNFSLLTDEDVVLSPAYDLLSTALLLPEDKEELALPLNGKKNNLRKNDFVKFAEVLGINKKVVERILIKMASVQDKFNSWIDNSFLTSETKKSYKDLISQRIIRIL